MENKAPTTPSPERQPADAGGGLLPCPWCGGEGWLNDYEARWGDMPPKSRCPQCRSCGANLGYRPTPAKAIAAWNRRSPTQSAAQTGEVECEVCKRGEVRHFSMDDGFWVEITTSAGGANEHGLNGWIETLEHYPDGLTKRREYVATDSPALSTIPARPAAPTQSAARTGEVERLRDALENTAARWLALDTDETEEAVRGYARKSVREIKDALSRPEPSQ